MCGQPIVAGLLPRGSQKAGQVALPCVRSGGRVLPSHTARNRRRPLPNY